MLTKREYDDKGDNRFFTSHAKRCNHSSGNPVATDNGYDIESSYDNCNDDHKMGPRGVNAPARRLSTMTTTTVGACPAPVHP